jgi:Domain of unknown function (DUF6259)
MKHLIIVVLLIVKTLSVAYAGTYRIESEDMPALESWTIATLSTATNGKYLKSMVSGDQNKISASFSLPESGTYYLWCRAYSYNEGWRKFKIAINGDEDSTSFGDVGTVGWVNASGSRSYALETESNTLTITPESAYSRYDVIILTTDSNYQMPTTREDLELIPKITPKIMLFSDSFELSDASWKGDIAYDDNNGDRVVQLNGKTLNDTLQIYLEDDSWEDYEINFKMKISDFGANNWDGAGCKIGTNEYGNLGYYILFRTDGTVRVKKTSDGTLLKTISGVNISTDQWYDVRFLFAPGMIIIYLDGEYLGHCINNEYKSGSFALVSAKTDVEFNDLRISKSDCILIENDKARIRLRRDVSGSKCSLIEYYDKDKDYNYLTDISSENNIWEVEFYDSSLNQYTLSTGENDSLASPLFSSNVSGDQILDLSWSGLSINSTANAVDVGVKLILKSGSTRLETKLSTDLTNSSYGLFYALCPKIDNISDMEGTDYLAHPYGAGRLAINPVQNWVDAKYSYSSANCGIQMFAYYDDDKEKGLYIATEDGDGYMKEYQVDNDSPCLSYSLIQYPEVVGVLGQDYVQSYPFVLQSFSGDYIDAAKIYRQWAVNQMWCDEGKVSDRTDMGYIKDIDLLLGGNRWFSFSPAVPFATEWEYSTAELQAKESGINMTSVTNHFTSTATASRLSGTNMIHFATHWFLDGFDRAYPRFAPVNNFSNYTSTLLNLGAGIKTMPYTNIRRSCSETGFDWWDDNDGDDYAIHDKNSNKISVPLRDNDFCVMSPGSSLWNDCFTEKCDDLATLGAKGMYLDELSAMAPFINYQAVGTQAAGASGKIWIEDSRDLCADIKAAGVNISSDFFTCGEQISESYLDVCDASLLYGQSKYTDNIPLFAAVYHDYTIMFGKTIGKWSDPYLAAFYPTNEQDGTTHQDEFITRVGKITAMGEGAPFLRGDIVDFAGGQNSSPIIYLEKIVKIRENFEDYLRYGEMLDYREGGCSNSTAKSPKWMLSTTLTDVTIQSVISSSWKSVDSSDPLGLFIVNVASANLSVTYPLDIKKLGVTAPTGVTAHLYKGKDTTYTTINQTFSEEVYEINLGVINGKTPYFCKLSFTY